MRFKILTATCAVGLFLAIASGYPGQARAGGVLGDGATCQEIAANLGIAHPDCGGPAVTTRGLTLGGPAADGPAMPAVPAAATPDCVTTRGLAIGNAEVPTPCPPAGAAVASSTAAAAAPTESAAGPADCVTTRGLAIGNASAPVPPPCPPTPAAGPTAGPVSPVPAAAPAVAAAVDTPPSPVTAAPVTAAPVTAAPVTAAPVTAAPVQRREYKAAFKINFEFASSKITADSRVVLDRVGQAIGSGSAEALRFRIVGHTDAVGSAASNLRLSEQRAAAVRQYLLEKGIAGARLESVGKGESEPVDRDNPNSDQNRRVEIINLGGS